MYSMQREFVALKAAAERSSDIKSYYELGRRYERGMGTVVDTAEANRWYQRAFERDGISQLKSMALNNDAQAQFILGRMYDHAQGGLIKDEMDAVKWYRMAADQGCADAQYSLGICYSDGRGVGKNEAEAVRLYRMAADQGHADAQYGLGYCYKNGQGVVKNEAEAVKWHRMAADQGYAYAQHSLGICYENGQGVVKNVVEAVRWYRMAADQGHASAQYNLGYYYKNGQGVVKNEAEAVKWYRMAADQGHVSAQCGLGICYHSGQGVAKNEAEAVYWYRKAVAQGCEAAATNLGRIQITPDLERQIQRCQAALQFDQLAVNTPSKPTSVRAPLATPSLTQPAFMTGYTTQIQFEELLEQAETTYEPKVCYEIGYCYDFGRGIGTNQQKAERWYARAFANNGLTSLQTEAQKGSPQAQWIVGRLYDKGQCVEKNNEEAVKWYRMAADQGNASAQNNLGICYHSGQGVAKNEAEAVYWYRKAVAQGCETASANLGRIQITPDLERQIQRRQAALQFDQLAVNTPSKPTSVRAPLATPSLTQPAFMTGYTTQIQNELIERLNNQSLAVLDFSFYEGAQDIDVPPVTLVGHANMVYCVAVLPNGQVVSGDANNTLRIWDINSSICVKELKGHARGVYGVAVLPNGQVVSASDDKTLRVWDIHSGTCVKVLNGHTNTVRGVAVLPNNQVVSASSDKTLRVWDVNSGICVKELKGHANGVCGVAVLPNGQVVSVSFDNTLRVWDIHSGTCVKVLNGHTNVVFGVAVLPNNHVVSASEDCTLRIWDINSGVCVKELKGHVSGVHSVAVLPNNHVVSGSDDATIRVWDINRGVCVKELKGHTDPVYGVAVLPNGQVVSASWDFTLRVWTPFPRLSYEMIASVLSAITPSGGLEKLSCQGVDLGEAGYQHILHLIKTIPTLETIDVSNTDLTANQENELQQILREQRKGVVNAPIKPASVLAPLATPSLTQPALPQTLQLAPQLSIPHDEVTKGQSIGQGGFGTVYKAIWEHTPVALKELDIRNQLSTALLDDFRQEASIMTDLRHPRIVSLYGATFTPPYWLVLELMSKGALSTFLYSTEEIDWPLRMHFATQIIEGLVYLHSRGIIHQDLKSMNILLDEKNQAKIADFGLAKLKAKSQTSSLHSNPTGTLAWIAPEILTQEKGASSQTDMFSYGMILWELAARKAPYENAGNAALIIAWAIQGKFPAIPEETPPAFRQLIEGCRSASETRPTAKAVLEQLKTWESPAPQHALSSSQNEEIKDETPIDSYQGALASGNFLVDSASLQNSQPAAPSVRGALQDYRGAMFSNRGTASQASGRGQPNPSSSRGRPPTGQLPSQRGTKPSSQGSCRHQ